MALPFVKLKGGKQVKLGRKIPETPPPAVELARFFRRPEGLKGLPENLDYWTKAGTSIRRMYLNDRLGCCVVSGKMHQLGVYSANNYGADKTILATDPEVRDQYTRICGAGDNGCYITAVLNWWMKNGLKAGGKVYPLDGYAKVDSTDLVMLKTAIHIFGSVTFGIDLPAKWLDTDDGEMWDVTNSGSVGGHDVPALGYDHRGVVISTWGGTRVISWAALESRRYIDECYVQLSPQWYSDYRLSPSGFDVDGLKKALEEFKGGVTPSDPDKPPEPPTPQPPTPPAPAYYYPTYLINLETTLPDAFGGAKITVTGHLVPEIPHSQVGEQPRGKFDWKELLAVLLPIILKWLGEGIPMSEILDRLSTEEKAAGYL